MFTVKGFEWAGGLRDGCLFSVKGFGWAGVLRDNCVYSKGVWVGRGF